MIYKSNIANLRRTTCVPCKLLSTNTRNRIEASRPSSKRAPRRLARLTRSLWPTLCRICTRMVWLPHRSTITRSSPVVVTAARFASMSRRWRRRHRRTATHDLAKNNVCHLCKKCVNVFCLFIILFFQQNINIFIKDLRRK